MPRSLVAPLLAIALVVAAAPPPVQAGGERRDLPRLRPLDGDLRALVQLGLEVSPSLRALAQRLERSDVVVYLRGARLATRMDGQLTFLSSAAGLRYVVVEIAWDRAEVRRLATLAHELQHAVEIAEHPAIVDPASLAREFGRFGVQRETMRGGWQAFDTAAAIDVGHRVWREVTGAAAADD
jgi:hypothetical protein